VIANGSNVTCTSQLASQEQAPQSGIFFRVPGQIFEYPNLKDLRGPRRRDSPESLSSSDGPREDKLQGADSEWILVLSLPGKLLSLLDKRRVDKKESMLQFDFPR
jgi:hypothetical protein